MKGLSFVGFLILLSACSYEFSEDRNFVAVPAPNLKLVTIDLDDVGTDTLFIYQPVNLKYTITGLNPLDVRNITLQLVNTTTVYGLSGLTGTTTLTPPSNTNGIFQLRLTVYSISGSGSLADKAGVENVIYLKEWPVTVNTQTPDPLPITSISRANGSLKIEWEKYALPKFSSYTLIRTTANSYDVKHIHDPDSNFYYDEEFLSGSADYSITLVADAGTSNVPGPLSSYTDTTTAHLVAHEIVSNQFVKLTWNRGAYPANVKRFEVRISESSNFSNGFVIHDSFTTTDTTATIAAVLGKKFYFFVRSSPSIDDFDENQVIKASTFISGETFSPYDQIRFSSTANRFYTLSSNQLTAYSMTDCAEIQTYNVNTSNGFPFDVNLDGDKVVAVQGNNRQAVVYNAVTFLPISQIDLSGEMLPGDYVWSIAFSQDDKVFITKTHLTSIPPNMVHVPKILVYDLASGSLVKIIDNGPPPLGQLVFSGGQSRLSHNEQFIYYEAQVGANNGAIAEIQNDIVVQSFILGWPLPNPSNADQILTATFTGNKIGVFDWPSGTFVNVINTYSDFSPRDFLPERNLVVGYRVAAATVFDYVAQQTLYAIEAEGLSLSLEGDYLYASSGARIKIN